MSDGADPSWRERSSARRQRADQRRLVVILGAFAAVGLGAAVFALTRPRPAEELTAAAHELEADWPSLPEDALVAKWFRPDLEPERRARLGRIFARRKWSTQRPAIHYVLDEMRHDAKKGRSEYRIDGFPEDRVLTVYWDRVGGDWKVSAPKIPVLDEK